MAAQLQKTIYTGTFIYTPKLGSLDIAEHQAIGVDEDGIIRHKLNLSSIESKSDSSDTETELERVKAAAVQWGWGEQGWKWVKGGREESSWWFPGFIDTHIHASQYPNRGLFGKTTLLSWLQTYTYPMEASLSSPEKAHKVYSACVARTLSHGTTTASYYATLHASTTNILADICQKKGQRAFIGRVCMDTDLSPEYYRDESPEFAIRETKAVIKHINEIDPAHDLITPILTPRFAPSCTTTLLSQLGDLASETQLPIQTHISENTSEVELVKSRFPSHSSYADVYSAYKLLRPSTVLAHGIHLTPPELDLIASHKSTISHCPVSNTSLSSGLCPVRKILSHNITVGLGTDVSGGYSSSVLVAAREASMVSRTLAAVSPEDEDTTSRDSKKLSVEECLYLATSGGAHCLGLGSKVGAFEVGMEWDAQLISLHSSDNDQTSAPQPSSQEIVQEAMEKSKITRQASNELSEAFTLMNEAETSQNFPTYRSNSAIQDPAEISKSTPSAGDKLSAAFTQMNEAEASQTQLPSLPHPTATPPAQTGNPSVSSSNPTTLDEDGPIELWGSETYPEKIAKWLFCGDDRNTKQVYVRGRLVHSRL